MKRTLRSIGQMMVVAAVLGTAHRAPAQKPLGVEVGLVPGADVFLFMNIKSFRDAAIVGVMEKGKAEQAGAGGGMAMAPSNPAAELGEKLGLEANDLGSIIVSVDIDPVLEKAKAEGKLSLDGPPGKMDAETFEKLAFSMALSLAKPVTLEQIRAAAAEADPDNVPRQEVLGGVPVLVGPMEEGDGTPGEKSHDGYMAVFNEGTLVAVGSKAGMEGMVERMKANKAARPSPAMGNARKMLPKGAQFALMIVPPPLMREEMQKLKDKPVDPGMPPMMAGIGKSFASLESLVLGLHADDRFGLRLAGDFGNDMAATQMKAMLDGVASMAKMHFAGMAQQQKTPLPKFVETLSAQQNASKVAFSISLGEEDLEMLQQAAMGMMMGGMMGGGMGGGPGMEVEIEEIQPE